MTQRCVQANAVLFSAKEKKLGQAKSYQNASTEFKMQTVSVKFPGH